MEFVLNLCYVELEGAINMKARKLFSASLYS